MLIVTLFFGSRLPSMSVRLCDLAGAPRPAAIVGGSDLEIVRYFLVQMLLQLVLWTTKTLAGYITMPCIVIAGSLEYNQCRALCSFKLNYDRAVRSDDVGAGLNLMYITFFALICVILSFFIWISVGNIVSSVWLILGCAAPSGGGHKSETQ